MRRFAFLLLMAAMGLTSSGCCFLYPQRSCFGHCGYGCGDTYFHDELNPWPQCDPCDSCGNWVGGGCDSCGSSCSHGGCDSCGGGYEGEFYGSMSHGDPMALQMAGGDPLGEDWRPNSGIVPEYRRVASGARYRANQGSAFRSWMDSPRIFANDGGEQGDMLAGLLPLNRRPHAAPSGIVYGDPSQIQIARSTPSRGRVAARPSTSMPQSAPRAARAPTSKPRTADARPRATTGGSRRAAPEGEGAAYAQGPRPGAPVRQRIDGAPSARVYEAPPDVAAEYAGSPGPVYMTEPQWYEGPARDEDRAGLVSRSPSRPSNVAVAPNAGKPRVARTPARASSPQPTRR